MEKSKHWDELTNSPKQTPIALGLTFPYQEGFPRYHHGKTYTVLLHDGSLREARVDTSQQYAAEGTTWELATGKTMYEKEVVAWCENEQKEMPLDDERHLICRTYALPQATKEVRRRVASCCSLGLIMMICPPTRIEASKLRLLAAISR